MGDKQKYKAELHRYILVLNIVSSYPAIPSILCLGERYPETRVRHFKGRNRRYTGPEEGGTHVFYSDFSGHGTETSN